MSAAASSTVILGDLRGPRLDVALILREGPSRETARSDALRL